MLTQRPAVSTDSLTELWALVLFSQLKTAAIVMRPYWSIRENPFGGQGQPQCNTMGLCCWFAALLFDTKPYHYLSAGTWLKGSQYWICPKHRCPRFPFSSTYVLTYVRALLDPFKDSLNATHTLLTVRGQLVQRSRWPLTLHYKAWVYLQIMCQ